MSTNPISIVPMPQRVWSDTPTPPRRELLWIKEGKKCHWCKNPTRYQPYNPDGSYNPQAWDMATIDHVIPRYQGGLDDESNLVSACRLCNNRRSHETNCGFPDGALLGKFDPDKGLIPKRIPHKKKAPPNRVSLTGDEKKAILGKHSVENVLREQRDQAQKEIVNLRRELKHWEATVAAQEIELKSLKSLTVWQFIRKRLSEWMAT